MKPVWPMSERELSGQNGTVIGRKKPVELRRLVASAG